MSYAIIDEGKDTQEVVYFGDDFEGLSHLYCELCHPNGEVSLCGMDISDLEDDDYVEEDLCVVCDDLDATTHIDCKGEV